MRRFYLLAAAMTLAACSETTKQQFEYIDRVHNVQMADDTYRIREHPNGDRLMVTPSLGKIAGTGLAQGATLGLVGALSPAQAREAAAQKYMNDTGRSNCRVVSSNELMRPHYQVIFNCA